MTTTIWCVALAAALGATACKNKSVPPPPVHPELKPSEPFEAPPEPTLDGEPVQYGGLSPQNADTIAAQPNRG